MDHRNPLFSPMPVLRLGAIAPVYDAKCRHPLKDSPCRFDDDKTIETCRSRFMNFANFDFTGGPSLPRPATVLHFQVTVADAEHFWAANPHLKDALETVTRQIRSGRVVNASLL
jgi:hypothetical protein